MFKPDELRQALMPTLEKLYRTDPESMPFRQPVDPIQLGIPDYLDIVKKPMDMGSIQKNLMNGLYSDPWEYVDDVWLMFDNAWLYNRKTSRVYRYCTKVCYNYEKLWWNCLIKISVCSSPKSLSKKSIQWCRRSVIAVDASTLLTHKCCAAMANNSAQFHETPSTLATRIGEFLLFKDLLIIISF